MVAKVAFQEDQIMDTIIINSIDIMNNLRDKVSSHDKIDFKTVAETNNSNNQHYFHKEDYISNNY